MLADKDAVANVAVRDLGVARRFYADVLGLEQVDAQGVLSVMSNASSARGTSAARRTAGRA